MNAEYKRDLQNNYLILEAPQGLQEEDFRLQMAEQNQIPGLLPLSTVRRDGVLYLQYEITSRQPLDGLYEKRTMECKDILFILRETHDVLEALRKFLLDPCHLIFEPEFLYVDPERGSIQFCYFPADEAFFPVAGLAEFILRRLDHRERQAVTLGYEFYEKIMEENFSLPRILKEILDKELPDKKLPDPEGKYPAGNGGLSDRAIPTAGRALSDRAVPSGRTAPSDREILSAGRALSGRAVSSGRTIPSDKEILSAGRALSGRAVSPDRTIPTAGKMPAGHGIQTESAGTRYGDRQISANEYRYQDSGPGFRPYDWPEGNKFPESRESSQAARRERRRMSREKQNEGRQKAGRQKAGRQKAGRQKAERQRAGRQKAEMDSFRRWADRLFELVHPAVLLSGLLLLVILEIIFYLEYITITEAGGIFFLLVSVETLVNKFWRSAQEKKRRTDLTMEEDEEMYRLLQEELYEGMTKGSEIEETRCLSPEIEETRCLTPEVETQGLRLVWMDGGAHGEPGPDIVIGPEPVYVGKVKGECDVILDSPTVSRRHARLESRGGICYVRDLNSRNGTFVAGRRLEPQEQCRIMPGDELAFAEIKYHAVQRITSRGTSRYTDR